MTFTHKTSTIAFLLGLVMTPPFCVSPAAADPAVAGRPNAMPTVAQHYYRMLAKVRPLLFWISRDNVGGARIEWRGDNDGARGFELLIGSDPARAPRKINKWGYIAEEVHGSGASVLGVMKASSEESIKDAEAKLNQDATHTTQTFKAIRATAANGQAKSDVLTVQAGNDLTYRDVGSLLTLIDGSRGEISTNTVGLSAGTRPGFLVALADLMHQPALKSVGYVYNGKFHDLHLRKTQPVSAMRINGRDFTKLVRAQFETENRATGERTPFEITYGTTGSMTEVPVYIVYQPKWWFQVELFLEDDATKF
jgi:hypothetical protein